VVAAAVAQADLIVVLDTGAWSQLAPLRELLGSALARTLILDHHLSGDVAARYCYVDAAAAAACEIVAQVIDRIADDAAWSPNVCQALFVGLAADTGWFRFSNTRAEAHELAARLLRRGVDQAEIYRKLEQNERPAKLALLARAVQSLTLLADNRAAIMVLRAADFAQTGALIEETEQLVDLPRAVGSVQVVALITEPPQRTRSEAQAPASKPKSLKHTGGSGKDEDAGAIRISFRSKPGAHAIDVSLLAQRFGGGGHARAAGAKIAAPLEEVVERVTTALAELFPER
jgi:phosphoesterase RecJ-like protein